MEPVTSVGAVREELRRLGYLESGLDRFVLSGRPSLLGASLRVGLAGGVLLGPLLTLAALKVEGRVLQDAWDLGVLALYASLLTGDLRMLNQVLKQPVQFRNRIPPILIQHL